MNVRNYFNLPNLKHEMIKSRKTLNIKLKIPVLDYPSINSTQVTQNTTEIMRTSSMTSKYRNHSPDRNSHMRTLKQTTIFMSYDFRPGSVPYCFSPIRKKYKPLPKRISKQRNKASNIPELIIKSEPKENIENSLDKTMHLYLIQFYNTVKGKYFDLYNEIDRLQKGSFDLDDIINYFIMQELDNIDKDFEKIKAEAKEIWRVLIIISGSRRVLMKHFFAFCSVFEHSQGDCLNLADKACIEYVREQIFELKELFGSFTDKDVINVRAILADANMKEKVTRCRVFVEKETVDFSRFLRCLPFFEWMHNTINNIL